MTVVAFHHLLLRLAGWAPDEFIGVARDRLARGGIDDVAAMIGYAAAAGRIPLAERDVELLRATLDPVPPVARAGARSALPPVAFAPGSDRSGSLDQAEAACVDAVELESEGTARAVWRAWRSPDRPTVWPPPKRILLVEAAADGELLALIAARLQEVLEHSGETAPQVEVFAEADGLPPYQRAALASAALIWGDAGHRPGPARPRVARLFDAGVQPGFTGRRESLAGPERDLVLAFLAGGSPVLAASARMADVLDNTPAVVPMACRSDGAWVWPDGVSYYLRVHAVAPEDDFLQHIRAAGYRADPIDSVAVHQALEAVTATGTGEPW
ncbi:hypothetical protein KZZ52_15545 [Dactylosporangium sp. AC04546]|uniref:hypothetical protein n=1 Tax=Dactylosporangium sp. AC04546 TaxID=2862460 RepID=UPI001EE0291C|nr:hypothetical protein [Dactylosporangium sp. AC04546]WVK86721.1 hypothetical protein KZZ52_15545 [Dactylosporangium sp. AC04546]